MSGRRILALARRILRQFRHDRRALALIFGVPLLVLSLLGYLLRGEQGQLPLDVVSLERASPSLVPTVVQALREDGHLKVSIQGSEAAARQRLREGKAKAYLLIPEGFTASGRGRQFVPVKLVLEGSNPAESGEMVQRIQRAVSQAASIRGAPTVRIDYVYGGPNLDILDYYAPVLIGFFAYFFVFLLTSVSFLRERVQGTLERLMASPLKRGEIVLGYMLGFSVVALLQALLILLFSVLVLRIHLRGNLALAFLLEALLVVGAVNLGIFLSTFARSEFQAVQFIPLVVVPQAFLSGLIFPVEAMPAPLQALAQLLPLTYAAFGLRDVMIKGFGLFEGRLLLDVAVLLAFASAAVVAATLTLRRRVA